MVTGDRPALHTYSLKLFPLCLSLSDLRTHFSPVQVYYKKKTRPKTKSLTGDQSSRLVLKSTPRVYIVVRISSGTSITREPSRLAGISDIVATDACRYPADQMRHQSSWTLVWCTDSDGRRCCQVGTWSRQSRKSCSSDLFAELSGCRDSAFTWK